MAERILHTVTLLGHWGYLIIFLAAFLESSAFMGLLVPGESVVVLSGFLASKAVLDIGDCIWIIALGAVLGDSVGYSLGKALGRGYFQRHSRLLLLKEKHIHRVEEYFEHHGGKTIFFGRFIGLLRAMAPFVAGMSRMPYGRFFIYNASGGILWAVAFTLLGYFFGQSWQLIERWAGRAGVFAVFVLLVIGGFGYIYRKAAGKREEIYRWFQERAEKVSQSRRLSEFVQSHPRMVSFIKERLSPRSYLGLHLTVGLLVSVLFVWLFGGITEDILTGDPFVQVDRWVVSQVLYFRAGPVTAFMKAITHLGGGVTIAGGSLILIVLFLLFKRWDYAVGQTVAVMGGSILVFVLKAAVHRPRPITETTLVRAWGWSFPSGHAMMSVIFYGMLSYYLVRALRQWRFQVLTVTASGFLVFLIGLSRIYLQVHYLSDVIGGFAGGMFWLSVCITGLEVYRRRKRRITNL